MSRLAVIRPGIVPAKATSRQKYSFISLREPRTTIMNDLGGVNNDTIEFPIASPLSGYNRLLAGTGKLDNVKEDMDRS